MKKKSLFLLGSAFAAAMLVGGTFAAWAVNDDADPFSVQITPGTLEVDTTKSVTLEWGEKGLVNIEGLTVGEEKGPYVLGLKASTSDGSAFKGNLSATMHTTETGETKLIDYLHVKVYEHDDKSGEVLMEIPDALSNYTVNKDITVTSGVEKKVYFFITLDHESSAVYDTIKNQVVTLTVDWNKGSDIEETTATVAPVYFNNTASWEHVYAHAWNGTGSTAWPGVEMTATAKAGIFTVNLDTAYDHILFHNGSGTQTADLELGAVNRYWDGDSWEATPDLSEVVYHLVGTINEWTPAGDATKMQKLEAAEQGGFMYKKEIITTEANQEIKVVSSENTWYAEASTEGNAANFVLGGVGTYTIYFNPTKVNVNEVGEVYIFCTFTPAA